jgi:hypothetical protein
VLDLHAQVTVAWQLRDGKCSFHMLDSKMAFCSSRHLKAVVVDV